MELLQPLSKLPGAVLMRCDVGEPVEDVLEPCVRVHLALHQGRGDNLPSRATSLRKLFGWDTDDTCRTPPSTVLWVLV